jgi:hypothetical protein
VESDTTTRCSSESYLGRAPFPKKLQQGVLLQLKGGGDVILDKHKALQG